MSLEMLHPQWKRNIRGVLFDMDGVIVDTERLYTRFWQEAAQAFGCPMTREQALGMRSLNRDTAKEKMESYFGPDTPTPPSGSFASGLWTNTSRKTA